MAGAGAGSLALVVSAAPRPLASAGGWSTASMAIMLFAPLSADAIVAERPTAPAPKIATTEPASGRRALKIAPAPVARPQPSGPNSSIGASSATFTTPRSVVIEYVENDDWPKKWPWTASLPRDRQVPPVDSRTPAPTS